jgi:hypothetical protein
MLEPISSKLLAQRWLHSHEEDTASEMVFRKAYYQFPPSRGRTGFELREDHSLVEIGVAPGDGPSESAGYWELGAPQQLRFCRRAGAPPFRAMDITQVEDGLLRVKK